MATLASLKRNINTTESLSSIVGTMKAFASSNIMHFQQAADASGTYAEILSKSLSVIFAQDLQAGSASDEGSGLRIHVVFGSDFGLTGRFNERIVDFALREVPKGKNDLLIVIGQQVLVRLRRYRHIDQVFSVPQTEEGITRTVQRILSRLDEMRATRPLSSIELYYNKPIGKASMREVHETLFPLEMEAFLETRQAWPGRCIPELLTDPDGTRRDLIQQFFFITLYRTFCDSLVTENASRLASMQSAERNIRDRLDELSFRYRQERQSQITDDINDIISGYKAISRSKEGDKR